MKAVRAEIVTFSTSCKSVFDTFTEMEQNGLTNAICELYDRFTDNKVDLDHVYACCEVYGVNKQQEVFVEHNKDAISQEVIVTVLKVFKPGEMPDSLLDRKLEYHNSGLKQEYGIQLNSN